ncbi:uncharacterized protein CANTADRAFT_5121 [Suhomyces tanzawaensis NRRL Y-17324]|uniref:Uncharacterized protein n=1 Tax=Suhomyces tanzawaensis NRRL Y-17324 TaxID=984487 RepID=A0A1E4SNT1_9ASCO|nr:uncharacterized protein CANTADRAFT_5121 [Suhomyces tanzawaensis NRRL Y-17324]ODV81155.1 hypothetical protein CANTADRAFT_5121 [Suhomyces tanzawaensis NRRL Y-17324]
MPDLFDNFFGKINTKLNGGKTNTHYGASSQVNTGKFYSYHTNGTNNNYWLPRKDMGGKPTDTSPAKVSVVHEDTAIKPRMNSMASMSSESEDGGRSRFNSVSSESEK